MFYSQKEKQKAREAEKKLLNKQVILDRYIQAFQDINSEKRQMEDFFEQMIASESQLDQNLTEVVHSIKEAGEHTGEVKACDAQRKQDMALALERTEAVNEVCRSLREQNHGQRETVRTLTLNHQRELQSADFLKSLPTQMAGDIRELKGHAAQMQEQAGQMSVLALNAAIEAGRMGTAGEALVQALQQVQNLADSYEAERLCMEEKLTGMQQKIDKMSQDAENHTTQLLENHKQLEQLAEKPEEVQQKSEDPQEMLTELLRGCEKKDQEQGAKIRAIEEKLEQALAGMESAGESFIEEQRSSEDLKQQLDRIWEAMKLLKLDEANINQTFIEDETN